MGHIIKPPNNFVIFFVVHSPAVCTEDVKQKIKHRLKVDFSAVGNHSGPEILPKYPPKLHWGIRPDP